MTPVSPSVADTTTAQADAAAVAAQTTDPPRVRLLPASQAPLLTRPFYNGDDPGPMVTSLAQVPELAEVALPFLGKVLAPSSIPFRTKEIVILRTSAVLECTYCVGSHTPVAREAGLAREEVAALREQPTGLAPPVGTFTDPAEGALLAWVDAVAGGGPGPVPQSVADGLAAHFQDHEVVELTLLVGATMMLNRYCTALQLPLTPETLDRLAEEGWL